MQVGCSLRMTGRLGVCWEIVLVNAFASVKQQICVELFPLVHGSLGSWAQVNAL